jgi:CheY-like chemotaxis protein
LKEAGPPAIGKRIMVVDDEEVIRNVVKGMLEALGHVVTSACDGAEAIDAYRAAAEAGRPFDMIIMDLTIPGGMGGVEATRQLLEYDKNAMVIVSSGYANEPVLANYREYGFAGIISKPYLIKDLKNLLQTIKFPASIS